MAAAGPSQADLAALQAEMEEVAAAGEQMRLQLAATDEQRAIVREILTDYERGRAALEAIKSGAAQDEVLVPLGGGAFAAARLVATDKVLQGIGSGVQVESSVDDALRRIAERAESARAAGERLDQDARRLAEEIGRVNRHLQMLADGARLG